jgi:glycosyltransferase involved in cell wall biosynthesis
VRLEDFEGVEAYRHPRPYILGIGRHVKQKGFDVLIEAFAAAGLGSYDLLLAGDGPERVELERLARKVLIEAHVKFIGRADRSTAVGLFCGCEFFALPSRQEPLGIVNLEAMAAGKAVIASRTGGVPEIVTDGETGLLVAPGDAGALAGALRRLAGDGALRERLEAGGRERVKGFAWEAVAGSYRQIYESALARGGRAETGMDPAPVPLLNAE